VKVESGGGQEKRVATRRTPDVEDAYAGGVRVAVQELDESPIRLAIGEPRDLIGILPETYLSPLSTGDARG
jgi:hypothetical protein